MFFYVSVVLEQTQVLPLNTGYPKCENMRDSRLKKDRSRNIATGGYTGSNMLSIKVKFNFWWKSLTSQLLGKYSLFFENSFFVCKNLLGSLFLSKKNENPKIFSLRVHGNFKIDKKLAYY